MHSAPAAAASIDDHIATQPVAVQAVLQHIRHLVHEEAPAAQEAIRYRMPAFVQDDLADAALRAVRRRHR